MQYGANFENFLEDIESLEGPEYEEETIIQRKIEEEKNIRQQILKNNYLHHMKLSQELEFLRASLSGKMRLSSTVAPEMFLGRFYHDILNDNYIYASQPVENDSWQMLSPADIQKELNPFSFARFRKNFQDTFWNNILLPSKVRI